jgi:hypothetical protein
MKTKALLGLLVSLAVVEAVVAGPKTYTITGPVLAMDDTSITLQAGKEKWQFARGAATAMGGSVKVGDTVTLTYSMSATKVDPQAAPKSTSAAAVGGTPDANPQHKEDPNQ